MPIQRSTPFVAVLIGAMVASTFQMFALVVIAEELISELGITKWQFGMLGAANAGVGGILAPRLGRLTDQLGGRQSVGLIFLSSGVGLIITGMASTYWVVIAGSVISGLSQGWANPATNKLISVREGLKNRGVVTGFKQSGVQFSAFLSGLVMPFFVLSLDWHVGLIGCGVATLILGAVAWFSLDGDTPQAAELGVVQERNPLPPFVYQLAIYGLLMGMAGGGVSRFLPLFAEVELGFSLQTAGYIVALQAGIGVFARLGWGRATESWLPLRGSLLAMAIGGIAVFVVMLAAKRTGGWVLWVAAVLMAFTISAWNVVANLAVIKTVPQADAGRATGILMLAFLSGITISGPIVGWSVDTTDSYDPAWLGLMALTMLGALSVSREVRVKQPLPSHAEGCQSGRMGRPRKPL